MSHSIVSTFAAVASFCVAFGQTPVALPVAPPTFEVASVKPSTLPTNTRSTHDGIVFDGVTLRYCIGFAYHVKDFQISGPSWLGDLTYDIAAKMPQAGAAKQSSEMLQALLADRFKLKIHREKKAFPGYALTVAAGGFKLIATPADNNGGPPPSIYGGIRLEQFPDGHLRLIGKQASMTALANNLSSRLGSPVIDRTETAGNYDFSIDVSPEDIHLGGTDENTLKGPGVSVFDSIQKFGLKLKSQKVPLDVIVVDHAEKIPTEN
jgi:uncharacterized protein (TIGR03435 family)